ncbi:hypothetical protein [Saccharothrix yanglingensis]|uniref:SWIM-type domain-containing protein n=1 Tax=Saccharothrix yanglingensis TaxID=659496 RepID=A0ABU0X356_9PSEU|nr:hypothetical protein [Saccharothrix yanglingensis]MDQ2586422.1 hypothetical protein [Saccharothrix yanglingensis]
MTVPPVAPAVVADVLDALPPRLRKRVDAALDRAASWAVTADGDAARAELDAETTLTWTLRAGVLAAADDLSCTCLLAPKCLHRGIAVAAAEIGDPADPTGQADPVDPSVSAATGPTTDSTSTDSDTALVPVTEEQRAAAGAVWEGCSAVLRAGASGSGAVVRAGLLRAVHTARVAGLHRAASAGLRVAAALTAARAGDSSFDREALTAELVDLMLLCHDLRTGIGDPALLRGTARREYRSIGALRLHGLCTEPVVSASGYGGVVTHLVDDSGRLWTVPAVTPGGAERVAAAASGPVAVGESGLTHRALGRAGLLLSGGTASPDHRLGAGKAVRAVAAKPTPWTDDPLARHWAEPLPDQVHRAFHAHTVPDTHRPAGADLLFAEGVVLGAVGPALRFATAHGDLDLVGHTALVRENLAVLAGAPGLRLRVVARLLPDRPGTATALAASGDLALPDDLAHHVDLGLDRLQRSHVAGGAAPDLPARPDPVDRVPAPLRPLENVLHRITLGGRAVAAVASARREVAALRATGLTATADLLAALAAASRDRERDAFGRVVRDAGEEFPVAWLRAGLHVREFTRASVLRTWLAAVGRA